MNKQQHIAIIGLLILALSMIGCTNNNTEPTGNIVIPNESNPDALTVYFFWGDGCPHCTAQKPYMEELKTTYPDVEILMYETWKNPENAQLFQAAARAHGTTARGVPTTFIGEEQWIGFTDSMKAEMKAQIEACLENTCRDPIKEVTQE